ncbi:MAG TPA: kelch repeat-containing protein, partial [Thermoplasmata archaeon]|nr:kelch repeat-containing protein [Thermoplasmata archaeon]
MTTTIALLLSSIPGPPISSSVRAVDLPATTVPQGTPLGLPAPTGERASALVGASPLAPVPEGPGALRSTSPSTPRGASGGSAWWNLTPVSPIAPSARADATVVWDAQDGYVLLFGGIGSTGYLSDTWIFSSGRWAALTPSVHPSARSGAGIAFDSGLGSVVLFGGENAAGPLGDTWWFAGGRWSLATPSVAPSPRDGPQAAFDSSGNALVLFGGRNASNATLNDTWTYAGGPWTRWSGSIAPPPRLGATLTDDPPQAGVLLFGGSNGTIGNVLGDTWKFNASGWSRLPGAFGPPARSGAAAALDPVGPVELLFGGSNGTSAGYFDDLWDYANGTWAPVVALAGPSGRSGASIAWDALDGYLVLFGGINASGWLGETWVFVRPLIVSLIVDAHLTDPGVPVSVVANATGGIPPYNFAFQTSQGALRGSSPAARWNTSFGAPGTVAVTGTAVDRVGASASSALS